MTSSQAVALSGATGLVLLAWLVLVGWSRFREWLRASNDPALPATQRPRYIAGMDRPDERYAPIPSHVAAAQAAQVRRLSAWPR